MGVLGYVFGALLALVSIVIILVIILQQGNQQGLGVVSGVADSYLSKNKARSIDAKLARATKVIAALFIIFVIALNVLAFFDVL
ncbi:MAG: preprotein translocase subunit SecG [Ruminococcus sp.]|nr:preprotein translocase subunit SecG [Ruminococcus sp.]